MKLWLISRWFLLLRWCVQAKINKSKRRRAKIQQQLSAVRLMMLSHPDGMNGVTGGGRAILNQKINYHNELHDYEQYMQGHLTLCEAWLDTYARRDKPT